MSDSKCDKIRLKDAMEFTAWLMILTAEPDRKISVEMTYDELKKIYDSKWISVKDRLPPKGEEVLTSMRFQDGGFKIIIDDVCDDGTFGDLVTHWMPLPKPPEEE